MTPTKPAWAPEIKVILDRARRLTQHEIWCLAAVCRDPAFGPAERARLDLPLRRDSDGVGSRIAGPWRRITCA